MLDYFSIGKHVTAALLQPRDLVVKLRDHAILAFAVSAIGASSIRGLEITSHSRGQHCCADPQHAQPGKNRMVGYGEEERQDCTQKQSRRVQPESFAHLPDLLGV